MNKFNVWSLSSFVISFVVIIPILTVSVSFFEETSNYYQILKETFLLEYIFNSAVLLIGVLIFTFESPKSEILTIPLASRRIFLAARSP